MEKLSMVWRGVSPGILMHNKQLADPLNEWTKRIKEVSGKRAKTDADYEEMGRLEFLGGLYMDQNGPVIPSKMILATLIGGAKKNKLGSRFESSVFAMDHASLVYDGPRDATSLWENKQFVDRQAVGVQSNAVFRTRPFFQTWSASIEVEYDETSVNRQDVIQAAINAGKYCGIGDYRPTYGRFTVEIPPSISST